MTDSLASLGTILVALSYFAFSVINGKSKADKGLVETLSKRITLLEQDAIEKNKIITSMQLENTKQRETIAESQRQINVLTEVLENRSPVLETTLAELHENSERTLGVLREIAIRLKMDPTQIKCADFGKNYEVGESPSTVL